MKIGDKFNKLTVKAFKGSRNGIVTAQCDCGNVIDVMRCHLKNGNNKSCGCLVLSSPKERFTKHGHINHIGGKRIATPEYRAWQNMRNRCLNKSSKDYKYYGGRGITMDVNWNSFEEFLKDMGNRPNNSLTLDRIDSNKDYSKTNCRWATRSEQARNRPYAKTKTWELAELLNVKITSAAHYIWKVRAVDKGKLSDIDMSKELEQKVRAFINKEKI